MGNNYVKRRWPRQTERTLKDDWWINEKAASQEPEQLIWTEISKTTPPSRRQWSRG
jgi:hypothetical protein